MISIKSIIYFNKFKCDKTDIINREVRLITS